MLSIGASCLCSPLFALRLFSLVICFVSECFFCIQYHWCSMLTFYWCLFVATATNFQQMSRPLNRTYIKFPIPQLIGFLLMVNYVLAGFGSPHVSGILQVSFKCMIHLKFVAEVQVAKPCKLCFAGAFTQQFCHDMNIVFHWTHIDDMIGNTPASDFA